ncbi:MAG: glycosyltransferase family 39 protein [Deltaproteobacteria bacterium]|nr:MAG: glycosyltransferase family 39 protein [Deltaproteobacteria bacterium]
MDALNARITPRSGAALVLAAAAILLLVRLGGTDLWAPDEPRYGEIAEALRSMEHGARGLVVLHLNGEEYTQKPPLYFWLAAAVGSAFGRVTELAGRLPSALAGIGVVALTLGFGRRLLGAATGVCGAALLLTLPLFAHLARRVQLDVLLTLFETLALVSFWRLDRGLGRPRRNAAALHAAMGLAVLTKGPVGFLVPVLVMAMFLAWERRLRDLRRAFPPWAFALSLGPGLVWLGAAGALAAGGFLADAVGVNLFGRFFAGTSHARPFYYYLYQFPADFLPWALLWPLVAWVAHRRVFVPGADPDRARSWRFLLAWVLASLAFFTLSSGKRGLYLLPAFPAAALICADAVVRTFGGRPALPRTIGGVAAALGALSAGAGAFCLATGEIRGVVLPAALGIALIAIPGIGGLAYRASTRSGRGAAPSQLAIVIACVFAVELASFVWLFPALDPGKSPRPVARAAAALTPPGEPIGLWGSRALAGGIVYYGRRRVAELRNEDDLRAFLAARGRAIVVKQRSLEHVEAVTPVEVRASFRAGRRALLVVTPRAAGPAP